MGDRLLVFNGVAGLWERCHRIDLLKVSAWLADKFNLRDLRRRLAAMG